ncbi:MAG: NifB/NifX family molybdenum-iron cluster-binding protein [Candidatus Hodarchaeales archaeon]|jgi:predicted Fe-Mo cluster-binding NifX family protein
MKIGLPSTGNELSSPFANIFGRCSHFIIVETETQEILETYPNSAINAAGGAGIQAAQSLVNHQVEAVIAPQMGSNAFRVLQGAGVIVYSGLIGTLELNIENFKKEKLNEMTTAGG